MLRLALEGVTLAGIVQIQPAQSQQAPGPRWLATSARCAAWFCSGAPGGDVLDQGLVE